jgi:hypothetical protein
MCVSPHTCPQRVLPAWGRHNLQDALKQRHDITQRNHDTHHWLLLMLLLRLLLKESLITTSLQTHTQGPHTHSTHKAHTHTHTHTQGPHTHTHTHTQGHTHTHTSPPPHPHTQGPPPQGTTDFEPAKPEPPPLSGLLGWLACYCHGGNGTPSPHSGSSSRIGLVCELYACCVLCRRFSTVMLQQHMRHCARHKITAVSRACILYIVSPCDLHPPTTVPVAVSAAPPPSPPKTHTTTVGSQTHTLQQHHLLLCQQPHGAPVSNLLQTTSSRASLGRTHPGFMSPSLNMTSS